MQKGKASLLFEHPAYIMGMASVAGKKEGEGPLGSAIDVVEHSSLTKLTRMDTNAHAHTHTCIYTYVHIYNMRVGGA